MRCPPDEVLLHALDAAVRNGPAGAGAARGWQCRVNSGGRVRMSGTAHRARCSLARRRRPRSPATRLAPAWLSRTFGFAHLACERLDVNGVFPPHHSLKPAHKGTTRWVGSSPVDTCDRCLFVCALGPTPKRARSGLSGATLPEAGISDTGLHGGACEADWSGGRALTGQGRGSLGA